MVKPLVLWFWPLGWARMQSTQLRSRSLLPLPVPPTTWATAWVPIEKVLEWVTGLLR